MTHFVQSWGDTCKCSALMGTGHEHRLLFTFPPEETLFPHPTAITGSNKGQIHMFSPHDLQEELL